MDFFIDGSSPSSLQAWNSPDFKSWTSSGAALGLKSTSTSRGSSFSVDVYVAPQGGDDVAEIAIGLEGTTSNPTQLYFIRARLLNATTPSFDGQGHVIYSDGAGAAMNYTDHVSIAASNTGYLAIATGLNPSGGDTWTVLPSTSSENDQAGWVPTWGAADNISSANTFSRQVVSLGGGTFMTLADNVSSGTPQTVDYAVGTMSTGSWTESAVPFNPLNQDTNGWSAAVSGQNVFLVRYQTETPGYDFAEYSSGKWTVTQNTPSPSNTPVPSSGVLTATDGSTAAAVIIDNASNDIIIASSNNNWTWTNNIGGGSGITRQSLSGYSVAVKHQIAVTWTETSASPYVLKGALICVP